MPVLRQLFFYSADGLSTIECSDKPSLRFLRANGQVLAQSGNEQAGLYATDLQKSVLVCVGDKVSRMNYTAYGHDIDSAVAPFLHFKGQRKDTGPGCYFLGDGYRGFGPVLMRFNKPDSISPFGAGGVNAYSYCGGDPINRDDPSGHMWFLINAPSLLRRFILRRISVPTYLRRNSFTPPPVDRENLFAKMHDRLAQHNAKVLFRDGTSHMGVDVGEAMYRYTFDPNRTPGQVDFMSGVALSLRKYSVPDLTEANKIRLIGIIDEAVFSKQ
ncbi:RHS repeat-associated core domain-containing protein [Pseudomonas putida]|uniref:RHS repeat-associated core domain-containing protein n=1 Tax=Pseudomonas putida TaxID=303 RepID=A0A7D5W3Z3_PSEPU|nr:RHS repeat-associated core domain-containing protein [Pseudomonas putida]QLJ17014.1 RHS repeat-associated core domain-containing protein [Pseudomonas putida]